MKDLIKALQILEEYHPGCTTNCQHDEFIVHGPAKEDVSKENIKLLEKLGFDWEEDYEGWRSFRWGSD